MMLIVSIVGCCGGFAYRLVGWGLLWLLALGFVSALGTV